MTSLKNYEPLTTCWRSQLQNYLERREVGLSGGVSGPRLGPPLRASFFSGRGEIPWSLSPPTNHTFPPSGPATQNSINQYKTMLRGQTFSIGKFERVVVEWLRRQTSDSRQRRYLAFETYGLSLSFLSITNLLICFFPPPIIAGKVKQKQACHLL